MSQELIQHSKVGATHIHRVTNWRYQDTASRLAATFVAYDVDKMCYDMQTEKYYVLEAVNPGSGVGTWYELAETAPTTPGEANTISSVGDGVSIVKGKFGVDLRTKSIRQGANMSITVEADTITLNAVIPAQDGTSLTRIAGAALTAFRIVYQMDNTKVAHVDPTVFNKTRSYVGITLSAAAIDTPIVLKTSGVITNPLWAFTPGQEIWVGANGTLTQVVPVVGFKLSAGIALTATSMQLQLELLQDVSGGGGGGGGSVTTGTDTIVMGLVETNEGAVVITGQAAVTLTTRPMAWIGTIATADYTSDDHKYLGALGVSVTVGDIVPSTGFTVFLRSPFKLSGDITINWLY